MTLAGSAFGSDFALRHAAVNDFLNDFFPVHDDIITKALEDCKRQSDEFCNHNCEMSELAERLFDARKEAGLTQSELAKLAKLKNQSIIGSLESGARKASTYIPKIAAVLGVESLWLATGNGPKRKGPAASYQLSESAMKIALAVNALPPAFQDAILHLVTLEQAAHEANESFPPAEEQRLLR